MSQPSIKIAGAVAKSLFQTLLTLAAALLLSFIVWQFEPRRSGGRVIFILYSSLAAVRILYIVYPVPFKYSHIAGNSRWLAAGKGSRAKSSGAIQRCGRSGERPASLPQTVNKRRCTRKWV